MTMVFEDVTGSDLTLNADNLSIVRKFRARDKLPNSITIDYFDYVSSQAMAWVQVNLPHYVTPYGILYWNTIQVHENHYALNYDISVTYGPKNRQTGAYQITVDGTGGTVNVTQGTVIGKFGTGAPSSLTDVSPLIGVEGETVRGIDIPVEKMSITVSYRHPGGWLNANYAKTLSALVGYPNNDTFLTYAPGEVMFLGPRFGESQSESSAEYSFAVSRNLTDFVVAGITIDTKYGWDILDPVYKDDTKDGKPIKTVDYFKTIRPAGRSWVNYVDAFGWGG
jgi:hypothetical protein